MNIFFYIDLFFIIACLLTVIFQLNMDPQDFIPKLVLLVQLGLAIFKAFKYLKIISIYSPLVTLIQRVIYGMRFFLLIFFINIVIFTQTIKIMEIDLPAKPYKFVGFQVGYTIEGMKLSLRKNTVIKSFKHDVEEINRAKTIVFWIVWIIVIFVQAIIFLKFIKAEAKANYVKVKKVLREVVVKDKCVMISEAENMMPK